MASSPSSPSPRPDDGRTPYQIACDGADAARQLVEVALAYGDPSLASSALPVYQAWTAERDYYLVAGVTELRNQNPTKGG